MVDKVKKISPLKKTTFLALISIVLGVANLKAMDLGSHDDAPLARVGNISQHSGRTQAAEPLTDMVKVSKNQNAVIASSPADATESAVVIKSRIWAVLYRGDKIILYVSSQEQWDSSLTHDVKKEINKVRQSFAPTTFDLHDCDKLFQSATSKTFLFDIMGEIPETIKTLDLSSSKIQTHSKDDKGEWVNRLKSRNSACLRVVNFSGVRLSPSEFYNLCYDPRSKGDPPQPGFELTHINLSNNNLGGNGSVQWLGSLLTFQRIEEIDLSHNSFTDADIEGISNMMQKSTQFAPGAKAVSADTLKIVDISGNPNMTDVSILSLTSMFKGHIALKKIRRKSTSISLEKLKAALSNENLYVF